MEYILKTDKMCKKYGKVSILKGLNMNIPKGAIYGFVGKNGAGKTTLIRQVCGLQKPTSGYYELFGIRNDSSELTAQRRRMGAIVESPALFKDMSARDNMKQQYINLGMKNYDGRKIGLP